MGNAVVTPCFHQNKNFSSSSSSSSPIKLIFWQGTMRYLKGPPGKHVAGEIMFEFPDMMVCHADSFFIGHPIPTLALEDELMPGNAYFVLPITHRFISCKTLSLSSLLSLGSHLNDSNPSNSSNHNKSSTTTIKFGDCPFEYLKGSNGRVLIKVMPEFITRLIDGDKGCSSSSSSSSNSFLCSTPELKKHYQMLVKSKDKAWSPKLETISEYKDRFSTCRFIGWKEKEKAETLSVAR